MATSEHVPVERGGYDPAGLDAVARGLYFCDAPTAEALRWDHASEDKRHGYLAWARALLDAYSAAAGSGQADALLRRFVEAYFTDVERDSAGDEERAVRDRDDAVDQIAGEARALLEGNPEGTDA